MFGFMIVWFLKVVSTESDLEPDLLGVGSIYLTRIRQELGVFA